MQKIFKEQDSHEHYTVSVSDYVTSLISVDSELKAEIFTWLTQEEIEVIQEQQLWLKKQIESRFGFQHVNYLEQSARLFFDYAVRAKKDGEDQYGALLLAGKKRLVLAREYRLRSGIIEDLRRGTTDDYLPYLEEAIRSIDDRIDELDSYPQDMQLQLPVDALLVALGYEAIHKSLEKIREQYEHMAKEAAQQADLLKNPLARQRAVNKKNFAQGKVNQYQEKMHKVSARLAKIADQKQSVKKMERLQKDVEQVAVVYQALNALESPELVDSIATVRRLEADDELTDEVLTYAQTLQAHGATNTLLKAFLLQKVLRACHEIVYTQIDISKHRTAAVKAAEAFASGL